MKILLLEPDLHLGGTYSGALEFFGHQVEHCQDAQTAISVMDKNLPDLVISELQLAGHNGVEFLYEMRSYSEWQSLPVIVISSVPTVEREILSALWQNLKISAYHYKPLSKLHDIIASVEQVTAPAV